MEVTEGQQGEINTTEDILLHFFKRRRHTPCHTWPRGKTLNFGQDGAGGNPRLEPLLGFL